MVSDTNVIYTKQKLNKEQPVKNQVSSQSFQGMPNTEITNAVLAADEEAQYDESAKRLLGQKIILHIYWWKR